jgi:hypothetical protein
VTAQTWCLPRYGEKTLHVSVTLDKFELGGVTIKDVLIDVQVYQFTEDLLVETLAANNGTLPSATPVPKPADSDVALVGVLRGKVGASSFDASFNTGTGEWAVMATIVIDTRFLKAKITGNYATVCRPQGDSISGKLSVFAPFDLMSAVGGTIMGTRFCDDTMDVRYNIFISFAKVKVLDMITLTDVSIAAVGRPQIREDGEVVAGVEDGNLDWQFEVIATLDIRMISPEKFPSFLQAGLEASDLLVHVQASLTQQEGAEPDFDVYFVKIDGKIGASFGGQPTKPAIKVEGDFSFNVPCGAGDIVLIRDASLDINLGPLTVDGLKARGEYVCDAQPGQWIFSVEAELDELRFGDNILIEDVRMSGRGRMPEKSEVSTKPAALPTAKPTAKPTNPFGKLGLPTKDDAIDSYDSAVDATTDAYNDAKDAATDAYNDGKDAATDAYNDAKGAATNVYNDAKDATENAIEATTEFAKAAAASTKKMAKHASDKVNAAVDKVRLYKLN